jgi:hypothetical protein
VIDEQRHKKAEQDDDNDDDNDNSTLGKRKRTASKAKHADERDQDDDDNDSDSENDVEQNDSSSNTLLLELVDLAPLQLDVGERVVARIAKASGGRRAPVQLAAQHHGHIVDAAPTRPLTVGTLVRCRVTKVRGDAVDLALDDETFGQSVCCFMLCVCARVRRSCYRRIE